MSKDVNTASLLVKRNRPIIVSDELSFTYPDSQTVSASQFYEERFLDCLKSLDLNPGLDRKTWEYAFIMNAIDTYCGFGPERRGLGFGVGKERLPSAMVLRGCELIVTDYVPPDDQSLEWEARKIDDLIYENIVPAAALRNKAQFREVDMNKIPEDLVNFDFLWSTGSLEHIGGLKNGLHFIENAMKCLRYNGIAVHTTEFTLTSRTVGYDTPGESFYCQKDIEDLAFRLTQAGHSIVLNFRRGNTIADTHVDIPPYHEGMTLAAQHYDHVITSIGLIIQKG
jgi:hypothetical protein